MIYITKKTLTLVAILGWLLFVTLAVDTLAMGNYVLNMVVDAL